MTSRLAFNSMSGSCHNSGEPSGFRPQSERVSRVQKARKNESSRRASLGKRPAADVDSALNNGKGIGATERSHGVMSTAYSPDR